MTQFRMRYDGEHLRQRRLEVVEISGYAGPQGVQGSQGDAGEGVPAGGTAGQVLAKASNDDYDTEWVTP